MALLGKMENFCEEYIVDYNAHKAAIRAGYSENSAKKHSYRILKRQDVKERICELQENYIKNNLLNSKNRVIKEYWDIYEKAMRPKPVKVWDRNLQQHVDTGEYSFDYDVAMKCLEFIAKLGGMLFEKSGEKPEGNFELVVKVEKDGD